ncbi:hypothetical protein OG948_56855 (plasmid) [Embleya sp. NBC_00888]|nr:hypothetical protein OG948_56855 [Embleya sp. NBC_00888]
MREAIARLAVAGMVSVVPQVGTRVEPIRLGEVEQARFVRESLEAAAFAVACEMPDRDVGNLRALLLEQERCHRITIRTDSSPPTRRCTGSSSPRATTTLPGR